MLKKLTFIRSTFVEVDDENAIKIPFTIHYDVSPFFRQISMSTTITMYADDCKNKQSITNMNIQTLSNTKCYATTDCKSDKCKSYPSFPIVFCRSTFSEIRLSRKSEVRGRRDGRVVAEAAASLLESSLVLAHEHVADHVVKVGPAPTLGGH
jgi:hypothetical protein